MRFRLAGKKGVGFLPGSFFHIPFPYFPVWRIPKIDRIADLANFNGINLLDGSLSPDGKVDIYDFTVTGTATTSQAADGKVTITLNAGKDYSAAEIQTILPKAAKATTSVSDAALETVKAGTVSGTGFIKKTGGTGNT